MRTLILICVMSLASWAVAEIRSQTVSYQVDGKDHQGTIVYDDDAPGRPAGVVVYPEWWGANDYAKSRARSLAELGYVAFVADMYGDGKTTESAKEAQDLAKAVYSDPQLLLKRAGGALQALRQSGKADETRIAAIGYCMGGTVALNLARSGADLKAVVGFHCGVGNMVGQSQVKARVLVLNGADDKMISDEEERAFEEEMRAAKADWVYVLFGGAMHSFTNPNADRHKDLGTIGYNQAADQRSWRMMQTFLAESLEHRPAAAAERGIAVP